MLPAATVDNRFDGKTVTPGFIEQHVHPALGALTMTTKVIAIEDWDYVDGFSPAVPDAKGYRARLASAIKEFNASGADMKTPLVTWGYHHYFRGPLDRAELDKLAGDRPVIVWHRSAHEVFFNTAALKLIELDDEFVKTLPAPAQAQIKLEKGTSRTPTSPSSKRARGPLRPRRSRTSRSGARCSRDACSLLAVRR